jgi:hypothetical protein
MNDEEKSKEIQKWSSILNLESGSTKYDWFNNYANGNSGLDNTYITSIDPATNYFETIQFPTIKQVMASTIGGGGWKKSKIQQLKEDRLNKLLKLNGEEPNVVLPNDEYVEGLVQVKPMSSPRIGLDYVYYYYKNENN